MADERLRHFVQTPEMWTQYNPLLLKGEIGVEQTVDATSGVPTQVKVKIGDGVTLWADLPYIGGDTYTDTNGINNPIGGISSGEVLSGTANSEILRRMLNVYQSPSISYLRVDGVGSKTFEIGTDLSAAQSMSWGLSNSVNIADDSGVFNQSETIFTSPGQIELKTDSPLNITPTSAFTKNVPGSAWISLTGTNTQSNAMNIAYAYYYWYSRIRWGTLPDTTITTTSQVDSLANSVLSSSIRRDYTFQPGYPFLLIPEFFANSNSEVTGYSFRDIDINSGAVLFDYAIFRQDLLESGAPATITYNNGNISYDYVILRGQNSYGSQTKLRIE